MDIQTIFMVVGFVLLLAVVLSMVSMKKQKSSWAGVLEKKIHREDNETANEYYTLCFRTDDGKKVKVQVIRNMYNSFNQGDRVVKKAGESYPEKTTK
jgi:hypothetical protein